MILVKASPVLTSHLEETMCVAAMTLGSNLEWIRLHPVPFRDLEETTKFRKYQEIEVKVIRSRTDRRPESWTPLEGSIDMGDLIGTDHGWSARRERISRLGEALMCDLVEASRSGSGPGTPSLSVVRTLGRPELLITARDAEQLEKWSERAKAIKARPSLFDDPNVSKPDFEVVPWRFRYSYRCPSPDCQGHKQTIVDWEIVAFWRRVRHFVDWQERMRKKLIDELWADGRETVLFVGNQEQHPTSFLVLGIFWPPAQPLQPSLL
jgi:hypothetical protein